MRRRRSTFLWMWLTTGHSAKHSFTKTLPRSGGRMSRSTLTMWALDTWPCCKWWECHTWLLPLSNSISSSTLPLCLTDFSLVFFPSYFLVFFSFLKVTFAFTHWAFLFFTLTLLHAFVFIYFSFHDQAQPWDMHQFWFEFFPKFVFFRMYLSYSKFVRHFVNFASLLKGYIQRLDGHYVCSSRFQGGRWSWLRILNVFVTSCVTFGNNNILSRLLNLLFIWI